MRLMIALVVWVGAVVGAVAVSDAVSHSIHNRPAGAGRVTFAPSGGSSSSSSGGTRSSGGGGSPAPDPSSIKSTDRVSLFRAANLSKALAKARAALGAGARLDNFALYPGYLSMTAVKGGGEAQLYIDAYGQVQRTARPGSPGIQPLLPLPAVSETVSADDAHRIGT